MQIEKLLLMQKDLDSLIHKNAGITKYPLQEIKIALLVELGELANEVQSFKYWKKNKIVDREKVLEEWADCFHFALSLENEMHQINQSSEELLKEQYELFLSEAFKNVNEAFELVFELISNDEDYVACILVLGMALGFNLEQMEAAYLKKNEINYQRQREGY